VRQPETVVIAGESIAGMTAARELRNLGYSGTITVLGAEEHGAYSRPPLSKVVLKDDSSDSTLGYRPEGLHLRIIRSAAADVDTDRRRVATADGHILDYDTLIIATGADARRLAAPGQRGEYVLRTLDDARLLRTRLDTATSAIVVGAGFLGMEVASACAARGIPVTVVDVDRPLQRILGPFLSDVITTRARQHGVQFRQSPGFVTLVGDPIRGVRLPDGTVLTADLVITCCGEVPNTEWLAGTGLAGPQGVGIDPSGATVVPGVVAAGDVTYLPGDGTSSDQRTPFWSTAVAQGRVAAASALFQSPLGSVVDDYFWTEILGLSIKIVGPVPVTGEPDVVEGSVSSGSALLTWNGDDGCRTVVAYGLRKPVPTLRALARPAPDARRHPAVLNPALRNA
jgi:3-phenylpropionate/trans-cinnamate dioxygenase ferredoxin reductase subunit